MLIEILLDDFGMGMASVDFVERVVGTPLSISFSRALNTYGVVFGRSEKFVRINGFGVIWNWTAV